MKKKRLAMELERLEVPEMRSAFLEQYPTPPEIAADLLFFAYSMGDIEGKTVCDLGCGNGIFAIGAAMLGADRVYGIDISENMVKIARENAERMGIKAEFLTGDVKSFNKHCDTAIQNPPFGAQNRHADVPFMEKAMEVSNVAYSMHMKKTKDFLFKAMNGFGGRVTHELEYEFPIKRSFDFHKKDVEFFEIIAIRTEKVRK